MGHCQCGVVTMSTLSLSGGGNIHCCYQLEMQIYHNADFVITGGTTCFHHENRQCMMTSSNGNIFRVIGALPRYSPVTGEFHQKGQWLRRALMFYLICAWINGWANNREAGDLRRHCAHYNVTVMDEKVSIMLTLRYQLLIATMYSAANDDKVVIRTTPYAFINTTTLR